MEEKTGIQVKQENFELEKALKSLSPEVREEYSRLLLHRQTEVANANQGKPIKITVSERMDLIAEAKRQMGPGKAFPHVNIDRMRESFEKYGKPSRGSRND